MENQMAYLISSAFVQQSVFGKIKLENIQIFELNYFICFLNPLPRSLHFLLSKKYHT